jgi:hypothetical protein
MKNRVVFTLVVLGVLAVALGAGFWLYQKLQSDREAVLSYIPPNRPVRVQDSRTPQRQTVTYTEKDLEEMRKRGLNPQNVRPFGAPPAPPPSNEAAVQRSLKTLEEVNRINEMNRRIQEQQEKMRNQR